MAKFFDLFPVIPYDISGKQLTNYQSVRNIFFRLRVVREVLNNISAYYEYIVKDYETPEMLAENIYGDAEAHWMILMANDIIDAAYDWPLNYDEFNKYIINKYGSIEIAKTTYHHYEEVIQRTESLSGLTTETRFVINEEPYSNTVYNANNTNEVRLLLSGIVGTFYSGNTVNTTNNIFTGTILAANSTNGYFSFSTKSGYFFKGDKIQITNNMTTYGNVSLVFSPSGSLSQDSTIPYFTYEDLAETQYVQTFNMGYASKNSTNTLVNAGRTVYQVSFRDRISNYDYEIISNEKKRVIKIIKPEYYPRILEEFNILTDNAATPFLRRLTITS